MPSRLATVPSVAVVATFVAVYAAITASPRSAAVKYVAKMTGAMETPANTEKGTGTARFSLNGTTLTYTITAKDLTGPATASHIHVGAVGVAGPPVYTITVAAAAAGKLATGTIDLANPVGATVSGDSLKALFKNGNAYFNVHTAAHPKGEIRGQIVKN